MLGVRFMARLCLRHSYLLCCEVLFSFSDESLSYFSGFFFFFPEEIVPHVALDSVCAWKEVSSGSSYVAILNWNYLILKSFDVVGLLFLKLSH